MFKKLIKIIITILTIALLLAIGLGIYRIYGDVTGLQKETYHINKRLDDKKLILEYAALEKRVADMELKFYETARIIGR